MFLPRSRSSWEKPDSLLLLGCAVFMCLLVCSRQLVIELRLECLSKLMQCFYAYVKMLLLNNFKLNNKINRSCQHDKSNC